MSAGTANFIKEDNPKPVAIFYNRGSELLNKRGFKIIEANSHEDLNKKIRKAGL